MEFVAENHSLYPRVGETDEELRLRRAYHQVDRDEIDQSRLSEIEDSYAEDVIEEQINADLDIVTDGLIRWYDHVSHLAEKLSGTEVAGLVRFFDTNYLVREANVKEPVEWRSPLLVGEYELARSVSSRPVKMILTGPLTLARHSLIEDSPYDDERSLAEDYTAALKQEVHALHEAGLDHLQIEEPSLLQTPEDADWVMPLLNSIAGTVSGVRTRLASYFGNVVPLYDQIQESAFDILVFDFTYSDDLEAVIAHEGSDKPLALGLLNGRNTKLEAPSKVEETVRNMKPGLVDGKNFLTFSCSIDYLPRNKARRKLNQLVTVRDRLKEGVAQV